MVAKFSIDAKATFSAVVDIPVAGSAEPHEFKVVFNHMKISDLRDAEKDMESKINAITTEDEDPQATLSNIYADHLLKLLSSWGAKEAMNKKNIITMMDNHPAAFNAICEKHVLELMCARRKS